MAQDLRELFKKDREKDTKRFVLKDGHEKRFQELLEQQLPNKRRSGFPWLQIAASAVILVTIGFYVMNRGQESKVLPTTVVDTEDTPKKESTLSLGSLSPDLKKVEDYYVANINLTLAKLEVSDENEGLVGSFMEELAALNTEYEKLNEELNSVGPNDQTINALIKNLQLRLQLLQKLKTKLNELNTSKNEQLQTNAI